MRYVTNNLSRRRVFTLVELLAAMAVLVVLMALLFRVIASAQQAWSVSDSNARVYAKAHVLFGMLQSDLGDAVVAATAGTEVPFWVADSIQHDPADDIKQDLLCFVAAVSPPNEKCKSRLCEVRYSFHTDPGDPDYVNLIRRSVTGDKLSDDSWNLDWDFYGQAPAAAVPAVAPAWVTTAANRAVLVDGVEKFSVTPFPSTDAGNTINHLPRALVVDLTVVDEQAFKLPEPLKTQRRDASRRQFRKIIYLAGGVR